MWVFGSLLLVLVLLSGCSPAASSGGGGSTYRGKVVDAETGKPIEGAVVVVVWYKKPHITMDGPTYFHDAKEVLTNAQGVFSVDASPEIDWNPFTYVLQEPRIVIFKPGYGPFPRAHVREMSIEETKKGLLKGEAVIKLPRIESKEELGKFIAPIGISLSTVVPYEAVPNLMRLINIQRKSLGLELYQGSFKRGDKP